MSSPTATLRPPAIYVWLVPSEQVLEQPGSWRIRKWDTEPFPEANYALSEIAENKMSEFPEINGAEDLSGPRQDFERSIYRRTDEEDKSSLSAARLSPKELIQTVRGVLSAVRNGVGPVAVVVNNNQPGSQHVIETAPNVTLDVGTPLYAAPVSSASLPAGWREALREIRINLDAGGWSPSNRAFMEEHGGALLDKVEEVLESLPSATRLPDDIFPLLWRINDCLRITPDQGVEFEGSTNDVDAYRDALHKLDPEFKRGVKP